MKATARRTAASRQGGRVVLQADEDARLAVLDLLEAPLDGADTAAPASRPNITIMLGPDQQRRTRVYASDDLPAPRIGGRPGAGDELRGPGSVLVSTSSMTFSAAACICVMPSLDRELAEDGLGHQRDDRVGHVRGVRRRRRRLVLAIESMAAWAYGELSLVTPRCGPGTPPGPRPWTRPRSPRPRSSGRAGRDPGSVFSGSDQPSMDSRLNSGPPAVRGRRGSKGELLGVLAVGLAPSGRSSGRRT